MARQTPFFCTALAAAAIVLALGACSSTGGGGASRRTTDPGTGRAGDPGSIEYLEGELARLRAERDRLAQTNVVLEDELRWAHDDLRLVERQFSEFEHRLTEDFGKAAAVSATAEARIHLDRVRQSVALPDSTIRHVTSLLDTAEKLVRNNNYPAAFFFAERANHTIQGAERRASLDIVSTARVVAVSTANMREGPGQHYPVLATLRQGDRVSCLDQSRSWYHVVAGDGTMGWIHASLLR